MATIEVQPYLPQSVLLRIDADNYEKHVSGVVWAPTVPSASWTGLSDDATFTASGRSSWSVTINYVQDWTTDDSLSQYLLEHEGETVEMVFTPIVGVGNKTFTADVTITPGQIGGEVNAYATTSVTLGSTKPVIGTAA